MSQFLKVVDLLDHSVISADVRLTVGHKSEKA
jgi:hypothetical protein